LLKEIKKNYGKENQKSFKEHLVNSLLHFLYCFFVYFIFIVPFDLWKKATIRLSLQKEKGSLSISKSTSAWPFFSFLKAFLLEFLMDGLAFISYFAGFIYSIYTLISTGEVFAFLTVLASTYFVPVILSILRDLLQLLILPFRKFLSWAAKPAQYLSVKIENK
jgi:hypothetical protein